MTECPNSLAPEDYLLHSYFIPEKAIKNFEQELNQF